MRHPLGIIAGGGDLPEAVAKARIQSGAPLFVLAIKGSTGDWVKAYPHDWAALGEVGRSFKLFAGAGVRQIVMAGRIERPGFSDLKVDIKGALLLPRIVAAARKGDDALLRILVELFREQGFESIGVAEAAPGLIADEGPLGRLMPDDHQQADIAAAREIVAALGALDVGQAAVVCEGLALAVEAAEGTDAMLVRVAGLREALRGTARKRRGVLVKALKSTQDRRTDLPVIGVSTVERAAAAGLAGIAIEAGAALVLDKAAVAAASDRLGLFVTGFKP